MSSGAQHGESMEAFVARRRREVARRADYADAAGRQAWEAATRSGRSVTAARPEDVRALGVGVLRTRQFESRERLSGSREPASILSRVPAMSPAQEARLRAAQQRLNDAANEESRRNSWLAIGALAPVVAVAGAEGAAVLAARGAIQGVAARPLVLQGMGKGGRPIGDHYFARLGQRAHRALKARVKQKDGWLAEEDVKKNGVVRRPDVQAPIRKADERLRYQMELKPNTPSGRRAAARAVKRYLTDTGRKTRAIFYDPKDYR